MRTIVSLTVIAAAGIGLGEGLSRLFPDLPRWALNVVGIALSVLLIVEIGRTPK
jgi:hypothetical protein